MQPGISLYFGLGVSAQENAALLERAAACGIRRVFTSLQIPEADAGALRSEFAAFLQRAKALRLEVISDFSPEACRLLHLPKLSFAELKVWGVSTLRVDFGYSAEEIARYSRNDKHLRIQLNASTVTAGFLRQLAAADADFKQIDALHNYYPRPGTGLSAAFLRQKNDLLALWGIRTGAFVAGTHKRPPLALGLPTLEEHRDVSVSFAARHLRLLGASSVFIGDAPPSEAELTALAQAAASPPRLKARLLTRNCAVHALLGGVFTARLDEARDALRVQESRGRLQATVAPENTTARPIGAITLDNETYGRYMGELQIVKHAQPADSKVNVVAELLPEERQLLPLIAPGQSFGFDFVSAGQNGN